MAIVRPQWLLYRGRLVLSIGFTRLAPTAEAIAMTTEIETAVPIGLRLRLRIFPGVRL